MRPFKAKDSLRLQCPPGGARDHTIPASPTDSRVEQRLPLYDFAWRWHHNGGSPPFSQSGDQRGRLGVDARAGDGVAGGASRFVHAHIGVGCIVRTDRPIAVELFAPRSSRHSFAIGARGIGASATSAWEQPLRECEGADWLHERIPQCHGRTNRPGRIHLQRGHLGIRRLRFRHRKRGSAVASGEQHHRGAYPSPRLNPVIHRCRTSLVVCVQNQPLPCRRP